MAFFQLVFSATARPNGSLSTLEHSAVNRPHVMPIPFESLLPFGVMGVVSTPRTNNIYRCLVSPDWGCQSSGMLRMVVKDIDTALGDGTK